MRHPLTILAALFCHILSAQTITSTRTTVYPGTDKAVSFDDTIVITFNHEAGVMRISVRNWYHGQAGAQDTSILSFKPAQETFSVRNGTCDYTFSTKITAGVSSVYFPSRQLSCVEVYDTYILLRFNVDPVHPVRLDRLTRG